MSLCFRSDHGPVADEPASVIPCTEDMSRIYLNVPFAEKEQAKGIGARWDGQRKAWWIDSTVDNSLFSKWLPRNEQSTGSGPAAAPTALPIFEDLDQAKRDWANEDIDMMSYIEECEGIEIVFVPWNCWRCHKETIVFHAGAFNPDASLVRLK